MTKFRHLPDIPGFSVRDDGVLGPLSITSHDENSMIDVLSETRFQRGKLISRIYANLVVLFRLLIYYADFKDHSLFWFWVRIDWGLNQHGDESAGDARAIANYYVQARIRGCFGDEQGRSVLARLVDEWRQEAARAPRNFGNLVEGAGPDITARRNNWVDLRDNHVDVLMDSRQPASLLGVALPEKNVRSLWEKVQDPVMAELMGPEHQLPSSDRVVSDVEPQSGGIASQTQQANKRRSGAKHNPAAPKRRKSVKSSKNLHNSSPHLKWSPAKYWETQSFVAERSPRGLLDKSACAVRPQSSQGFEHNKDIPRRVSHTVQANLKGRLEQLSHRLRDEELEVETRRNRETTGYVPSASQQTPGRNNYREPQEWDQPACISRIGELEDRLATLEKRFTQESDWARSIGTFLYDANEKTLRTFGELLKAVTAIREVSETILEGQK